MSGENIIFLHEKLWIYRKITLGPGTWLVATFNSSVANNSKNPVKINKFLAELIYYTFNVYCAYCIVHICVQGGV